MRTAPTATIEPTDRSMPDDRITNVMPTPKMPVIEIWRATLNRFVG